MINQLFTILEIIEKSTDFLNKKGIPNPKCDSEWIISKVLKKERLQLYLEHNEILSNEKLTQIRKDIIARGQRVPLQHILGNVKFFECDLKIDERALIPRPETELLVETVSKKFHENFSGKFLDLGTGSGAIIISLCKIFSQAKGIGYEKSKDAIQLAQENIALNNLSNVQIEHFDWWDQKIDEKYDLVISNPPYLSVQEWESTEPEVREFDPKLALVSKEEGLADIFHIINSTKTNLKPGGILALEIGSSHSEKVVHKLKLLYKNTEIVKDLNYIDRFTISWN